jgi:Nif-specific regulatory protein
LQHFSAIFVNDTSTNIPETEVTASLASVVLSGLSSETSLQRYLLRSLTWWTGSLPCSFVGVAECTQGNWKFVAQHGRHAVGPQWLSASQSLDSRQPTRNGNWLFFPIHLPACDASSQTDWIFAIEWIRLPSPKIQHLVDCLVGGLVAWRSFQSRARDVERMTQILNVAADWHMHLDLDRLLESIALAATKLLSGDRASIFLWDKSAKELVGHPALGIEGKPLRIPDNAGLAGAVLRSLEPRRWDRSDPSDEVNRRVDQTLSYRTDSLVAVPLIDQRGKGMGVFEVLNHRLGKFSREDERDLVELARHASAALANTQQIARLVETRDRLTQDAVNQVQLVGDSPQLQSLKATIQRVGNTDLAVLLLGENGTGKEVVSRQIHYQSRRRHEPFIAVNCAAITETLLESELFGHEKGAFTDAHDTRIGKFELANGGTLFLDEIGDMSLAGQAKLLRVLEEKVVVRVGGSSPIPVNVRVIAATNQNLVSMVQAKKFREDLYFRLTVVTLNLPPLRERREDILSLADFFMNMFCQKIGRNKPEWSAPAKRRLSAHEWPGNVRELRNVVERIAYLTTEDVIDEDQVDFVRSPRMERGELSPLDTSQTLAEATEKFQTQFIEQHIVAAGKNVTLAAEKLGLQRSNLYRKMKLLGMKPPE